MYSILIACVKGGVGKTHSTAGLLKALKGCGYEVAGLDVDYRSPNLPYEFNGLEDPELLRRGENDKLIPPVSQEGIPIFSLHYFWPPGTAVEVKDKEAMDDVRQLLTPGIIDWGKELDYLVIDTPPDSTGTLAVAFQAPSLLGCTVVCQPSRVSMADAERTICLLREKGIPILGVICNQAHLVNSKTPLFDLQVGDVQSLVDKYGLPKLWEVPHSTDLAPYFQGIARDLGTVSPVTLSVSEPDDSVLKGLAKLSKLLNTLRRKE